MGLGRTHYSWRPDVGGVVAELRRAFPGVTVNTYVDHPYPGWDGRSLDVWGSGGRGDPLSVGTGLRVLAWLFNKRGAPHIRHWIFMHTIWLASSGATAWPSDDHDSSLRHVHVTYF